jgi:hypothetical protein
MYLEADVKRRGFDFVTNRQSTTVPVDSGDDERTVKPETLALLRSLSWRARKRATRGE